MQDIRFLPATLWRKARALSSKLWVRVVGMGLLSLVSLLITQLIDNWVPEAMATRLTGSAADRLLDIIANAMLAATIFSITVMVSVYQSSSSQWTPRIHQLIMQDRITQNTLAAFIGTYLYALVAIILRELGVFVDDHALVLFWMTVLVLGFIVWSLVRWVLHLQTLGGLLETTRQIENITKRQFRERLDTPCLGANPLTGQAPEGAHCVRSAESGYILNLYPEGLQAAAERFGVELYLTQPVGQFVFLNEPLLWIMGDVDKDVEGEKDFETLLRDHIQQGDLRTYEQDPRFGLTVMGEIASKALSPGVNDPGTAIDVVTRVGRILSSYRDETDGAAPVKLDRLWVPPLDARQLLDDGFGAVMRDGAGKLEVQHRLQRTLAGLMQHPDEGLGRAARDAAEQALRRALAVMDFPDDRTRLFQAADPDVRADVEKVAKGASHGEGR